MPNEKHRYFAYKNGKAFKVYYKESYDPYLIDELMGKIGLGFSWPSNQKQIPVRLEETGDLTSVSFNVGKEKKNFKGKGIMELLKSSKLHQKT